eukprot:Opistho-1_new@784
MLRRFRACAHAAVGILQHLPQKHAVQSLVQEVGYSISGLRNVVDGVAEEVRVGAVHHKHRRGDKLVDEAAVEIARVVPAALDGHLHGALVVHEAAVLAVRHIRNRVAGPAVVLRVPRLERRSAALMVQSARLDVRQVAAECPANTKRIRAARAAHDDLVRASLWHRAKRESVGKFAAAVANVGVVVGVFRHALENDGVVRQPQDVVRGESVELARAEVPVPYAEHGVALRAVGHVRVPDLVRLDGLATDFGFVEHKVVARWAVACEGLDHVLALVHEARAVGENEIDAVPDIHAVAVRVRLPTGHCEPPMYSALI